MTKHAHTLPHPHKHKPRQQPAHVAVFVNLHAAVYTSYSEAANDYASLIQRRYPSAFLYRNEPEKFAEAVARQGYATDRHYAKKLKSIIHSHITPILKK